MKASEIDASGEIRGANWDKSLMQHASIFCEVDGKSIWKFHSVESDFYLIVSEDNDLMAYIGVKKLENGYYPLIRVHNLSKIGGLISMILIGLAATGMKFIIKDTEDLTTMGISWLIKMVKAGGRGLRISNQFGEPVDAGQIENEWKNAKQTGKPGPTSILIENGTLNIKRIAENNRQWRENHDLLIPAYRYFGDKSIL